MNRIVKPFSYAFIGILLIMFIQLFTSRISAGGDGNGEVPAHHVMLVCENLDSYFSSEFVRGARQAELEYDIFVEVIEADKWEVQGIPWDVRKGIFAQADGVAFQMDDPAQVEGLMGSAEPYGTTLVLYESDNYTDIPILTAGSDVYEIGYLAGELALETVDGDCRAVLVVNSTQLNEATAEGSTKVQGVEDAFAGQDGAELVAVYPLDNQVMSGDVLINTLLDSRDDFNTIICLNERTTPLLAQRLLDNALAGEIGLVGYGALPPTLDYIDQGIVHASIVPDAYDVGYNTVSLMARELGGMEASSYSSAAPYVITRQNADSFLLGVTE